MRTTHRISAVSSVLHIKQSLNLTLTFIHCVFFGTPPREFIETLPKNIDMI